MSDFVGVTTSVLRRTPQLLRALLVGLPEDWTDTTDIRRTAGGRMTWSATSSPAS